MDIEKMTAEQLLDFMAGNAIMKLGKGSSMRDIVWFIFEIACRWNQAQKKGKK